MLSLFLFVYLSGLNCSRSRIHQLETQNNVSRCWWPLFGPTNQQESNYPPITTSDKIGTESDPNQIKKLFCLILMDHSTSLTTLHLFNDDWKGLWTEKLKTLVGPVLLKPLVILFFCSTSLPRISTRWFDQHFQAFPCSKCHQLTQQHQELNSWECQESNPGLLGEMR